MKQDNSNRSEYVLGVDVGGTKINIGKAKRVCVPLEVKRYYTDSLNQDAIISSIIGSIEHYLANVCSYPPSAIGMGLVGHVSIEEGIWKSAINISVTEPMPICAEIYDRFGIPVYIDNDVHMAALAEMTFGTGMMNADFIYINIGTGISAGLVFNGKIIKGATNYAGEIGHLAFGAEDYTCKCGRKGCLEPIVSGGGMINMAKEAVQTNPNSSLAQYIKDNSLNAGTIFREAKKGDVTAGNIAERAMSALENTVVNLVNFMNPSFVIFGGGAIEKDFILNRLTKFVYKNVLPAASKGLKGIRVSALEPSLVGLIGASLAAWNALDAVDEKAIILKGEI